MSASDWIKPVIDYNAIRFTNKSKTIDFDLWVIKVDKYGDKSAVDLRYGSTRQTFVALFDDNDTDFEIKVYNGSHTRMAFDMVFGKTYAFCINPGKRYRFKTLESNGHQLRFLSPNLPTGQSVVDLIANKDPDSRRNAEIMCSRMKFKLGVGRPLIEEVMEKTAIVSSHEKSIKKETVAKVVPKPKPNVEYMGEVINVFVLTFEPKTITLRIGRLNTLYDLKLLIQVKAGINIDGMRLISGGKELDDDKTIDENHIQNDSTLHLNFRLRGGLKRHFLSERPDPTIDTNLLDIPVVNKYVGKRGVIGFGDKTDQKFGPYVSDFVLDDNYYIEPFYIEFRLKTQLN